MKNSENVSAFHDQKVSSAIINGLPHTWKPESEPGAMRMPDFRLMRDADPLEQRLCQVWVRNCLFFSQDANPAYNSLDLKEMLESDLEKIGYEVKLTNNQFKDLMLKNFHTPFSPDDLYWIFDIHDPEPENMRIIRLKAALYDDMEKIDTNGDIKTLYIMSSFM